MAWFSYFLHRATPITKHQMAVGFHCELPQWQVCELLMNHVVALLQPIITENQGQIQWGAIGAIVPPPKTYESNFFHHEFEQFGKQHSRYKAIMPSIALS